MPAFSITLPATDVAGAVGARYRDAVTRRAAARVGYLAALRCICDYTLWQHEVLGVGGTDGEKSDGDSSRSGPIAQKSSRSDRKCERPSAPAGVAA